MWMRPGRRADQFWRKVGGTARLADVEIACKNDYATVLVVSMDGEPIAASAKVLVQVGTREHSTGWATKPSRIKVDSKMVDCEQITSFGKAPWLIEDADIALTVKSRHLTMATVLDSNGMAISEAAVEKSGGSVKLAFPKDALYLVLH